MKKYIISWIYGNNNNEIYDNPFYKKLGYDRLYKIKHKDDVLISLFKDVIDSYNLVITTHDLYLKRTSLIKNNDNLYVYRGIYDHKESQTGGPFALYMLDNIYNDEVILVASIINNPGNIFILQNDKYAINIQFTSRISSKVAIRSLEKLAYLEI